MGIYILDNFSRYTMQTLEGDMAKLPKWRLEQAQKHKSPTGRRNCTLSYQLLCQALEREFGITARPTFTIGTHGKPSLAEFPDIHFNISHCATAIACAVSDRPVGIDVESTDRKISPHLVEYVMNKEEREAILNDRLDFFRIWTRKEAFVKLHGTGLQGHLHDILAAADPESIEFHTEDHIRQGYILSTATRRT